MKLTPPNYVTQQPIPDFFCKHCSMRQNCMMTEDGKLVLIEYHNIACRRRSLNGERHELGNVNESETT